jgi:hypothetical protein
MWTARAIAAILALSTAGCPGVGPLGAGEMPVHRVELTPPRVSSLRATAVVEQIDHGKRIRGRVYVLVASPASIRFDAMSPADIPLATLTADEDSFALMDAGSDAFYTGPPSPCNVARLLGIPMPPSSVAGVLTGVPPLIEAQDRKLEWVLSGYHLLTLRSGGVTQTVQILAGNLGVSALRSVVWKDDHILYDLRFLDRKPASGTLLPHRIRFTNPRESTAVELTYTSLEVDAEIPPGSFHQDPPPGMAVRHVDCGSDG